MVFQSFALMPHLTALDNAAFGLEIAGVPEAKRHEAAMEALEQVGSASITPATRARCRAACSSASAWPAPSPTTRPSC